MIKNNVTYAIILDERRAKSDNTYPLKLRLTFQRERKYYGVGRDLTKAEYQKMEAFNVKGNLRILKIELDKELLKVKKIIDEFIENEEEFSFARFEDAFFGNSAYADNLIDAFDAKIDDLKANGQISSATSYTCAKNSLNTFFKGKKVRFKEVTVEVLNSYEKWMLSTNKSSPSTIGIYMRNLRALFNIALQNGVVKQEQYPYGRRKYEIPAPEATDKGLPLEIIKKIYYYKAEPNSNEEKARDLWFFMYLSNGMNVKDLCRLKYEDFQNDRFTFKRAKTENTSKRGKLITVVLSDELIAIIKKWGIIPAGFENEYVFPFFKEGLAPLDERRISQNVTGWINDNMKKIATTLKLNYNITTYSAKHSHSNIMKESGAPIKMIADNLGHSSTQITEKHYLNAYDIEKQKEFTKQLLNFKK
ncbi:MAG: site-specific integrase [Chitinophagaceae bacterium]|jgi:integrase|nr:site-specific integrase [Chitinophagaceae bacterium]